MTDAATPASAPAGAHERACASHRRPTGPSGRVIARDAGRLAATLGTGEVVHARRALLATGVVHVLPPLPGLAERFGGSVLSCPYCHGYEARGGRWGVLVTAATVATVPVYRTWTRSLVALFDGDQDLARESAPWLRGHGVEVEPQRLRALHGRGRSLQAVELDDGTRRPLDALVVFPAIRQPDLTLKLGLALDEHGYVAVGDALETSMPGVYACGDAIGMQRQAIFAAADGASAARHIVESLQREPRLEEGTPW